MPENMIKYSILMPYYERLIQLRWTLSSLLYHYKDRADYEVIIVQDTKNSDDVANVIDAFSIDILMIRMSGDDTYNPACLFNSAARVARGKFLILTSPECLHWTNVLSVFDEELHKKNDAYVVAACESATNCSRNVSAMCDFEYDHHMWYQHSEHRNFCYHFCSVLSRKLFNKLSGFDERYANGVGYEDDDFIKRVREAGISIVTRYDAWTIHQEHKRTHQLIPRRQYMKLLERNRRLFKTGELQ